MSALRASILLLKRLPRPDGRGYYTAAQRPVGPYPAATAPGTDHAHYDLTAGAIIFRRFAPTGDCRPEPINYF